MVLGEAKQPLTTRQMIESMATEDGWTSPQRADSAQTLSAAILREINVKGNDSRFQKTERASSPCFVRAGLISVANLPNMSSHGPTVAADPRHGSWPPQPHLSFHKQSVKKQSSTNIVPSNNSQATSRTEWTRFGRIDLWGRQSL